jgi:heavy metal sensor kinase
MRRIMFLRSDPAGGGVARAPSVRRVRPHARLSLRWKLTLLFGLAFAAILAAIFITLNHLLVSTLLADADDDLSTHAQRIAAEASARPEDYQNCMRSPDPTHDRDQCGWLQSLVRSGTVGGLISNPSLVDIRAAGRVLVSSSDIDVAELRPTRSEVTRLQRGDTTYRTIRSDAKRVRLVTAPIMIEGQTVGAVQTGESIEGLFSAGDRLQVLLIAEGAVGLVLAAAFGYAFVRRGLRPLEQVGAVAADIEANDLTRRIGMRRRPIEVQSLADTFDAMLERLEQSFEQQRRFVLDVSHELRTPLTALRGNLDVLLMDPSLPAEVRTQVERMSAETGRLIRLAANLLLLGQADTGKQYVMAPVELDLLCLEVVQQARNLKPSVRLRLGHEDQVEVVGDRDLLKQLLLNLIENGLTYTPAGGQVTVSLAREEDVAALTVEDTGVGIAPDDLPHVFERFYRAESTRRRAAGGAGVGLSIVDWVARLHGGRVSVTSDPGKGCAFTVRLPLSGDAPDEDDDIPVIEPADTTPMERAATHS